MKTTKSEQNYIVELDEIEWYQNTPEQREVLLQAWRVNAGNQNCRTIAVFVHPDPLLPIHGIDRRTRVHVEKLASDALYEVTLTYHVEVAPDAWGGLGCGEKKNVLREIRDNLAVKGRKNPGRFEVFLCDADGVKEYLERGRV